MTGARVPSPRRALLVLVAAAAGCGGEPEPTAPQVPSAEELQEKARTSIDANNAEAELEKLRQEMEAARAGN